MWIFPKYKTNLTFSHAKGLYGAFHKNVRRNWGIWPMWISSANDKGFIATASTIVYDDRSSPDGRGLWAASSITGVQWHGCDFDDHGYSYFCGNLGTTKRDIMTNAQIWSTQSSPGTIEHDVKYNNGFVYVASGDPTKCLKKLDLNGNLIWSVGITSSTLFSIAFDESNNIYVCGRYGGVQGDGIIAKYDESGSQIWSVFTGPEMLDIKYYNKSPQIAPLYIGCIWQNNPGTGNDGAIHLRQTDGTDAGYFGSELINRNISLNGYYAIEVNERYVIAVDKEGNTQGIDVYMRTLNSLTASMTASQLGIAIPRIKDLELYDDNLYFCDFDQNRIYRTNPTFSRIDESWRVAAQPQAIRMKKTY